MYALLLLVACADAAEPSAGLVFVRSVDGGSEIVRARLADAAEQPVTATPERDELWPFWSDPAGRLLFQARRPGEPNDLYLWDPTNGRETPLVATPERDERWQQWSPDGRRVVYAFRGGEPPAGVAWIGLDGSHALLARSGLRNFFLRPRFAPGGERVVAQRRGAEGRGSTLWLLEPGRDPRPLTSDPAWFEFKAVFTPDASHIVYTRRPVGPHPNEIAMLELETGAQRVLIARGDAHSAALSPGGDAIAFVAREDGDYDLFLCDPSGADVRALTRTPDRHELAPQWSPDGERLAVTTAPREGGVPRLAEPETLADAVVVVLDREGRELFATRGFMPDWMPPWP